MTRNEVFAELLNIDTHLERARTGDDADRVALGAVLYRASQCMPTPGEQRVIRAAQMRLLGIEFALTCSEIERRASELTPEQAKRFTTWMLEREGAINRFIDRWGVS